VKKSKRNENYAKKVKKAKKSEKQRKKRKNRLEFHFALFRFEAKNQAKNRSEAKKEK
jgi:hypothetical protein